MAKVQAKLPQLGSGENKPLIQTQIQFCRQERAHAVTTDKRDMYKAIEENLITIGIDKISRKRIDLREALLNNGLDPDRVIMFIESNLDSSRQVNDLEPEGDQFFKTQLSINEAEILKLMLESNH